MLVNENGVIFYGLKNPQRKKEIIKEDKRTKQKDKSTRPKTQNKKRMTDDNVVAEPQLDEPSVPVPPTDPTLEAHVLPEDPVLQEEKEIPSENGQVNEANNEQEANSAPPEVIETVQNYAEAPQQPPQFGNQADEASSEGDDSDDLQPPVFVELSKVDEEKEVEMNKPEEPTQVQASAPQEAEEPGDNEDKVVPSVNTVFYLVGKPAGISKKKTVSALEKAYGKIPDPKVGKHKHYLTVSVPVPEGHKILVAIDEEHKVTIQNREFVFSSVIPEIQISGVDDTSGAAGDNNNKAGCGNEGVCDENANSASENQKQPEEVPIEEKKEEGKDEESIPEKKDLVEQVITTLMQQEQGVPEEKEVKKEEVIKMEDDDDDDDDDDGGNELHPENENNGGTDKTNNDDDDDDDDAILNPPSFSSETPKESTIGEKPPVFQQETASNCEEKEKEDCKPKHSGVAIEFYLVPENDKVNKMSNKVISNVLRESFPNTLVKKITHKEKYYAVNAIAPENSYIHEVIANNTLTEINGNLISFCADLPPELIPDQNSTPPPSLQPPRPDPVSSSPDTFTVTYTFLQVDGSLGKGFDISLIPKYLKEHKFSVDVSPADIRKYMYNNFPYYDFDVPYNPADEAALNLGIKFKLSDRSFVIRKDMDVYVLVENRSVDDVTSFIKANDIKHVIRGNALYPSTQLALIYQIAYALPKDLDLRIHWLRELISSNVKWVNLEVYWTVFDQKITPLIQKRLADHKSYLDELMGIISAKSPIQGKQQ